MRTELLVAPLDGKTVTARDGGAKTVSVVMATYNGARYIEEQVRSICNQTLKPFELIISDDASHDETLVLARRVASDSDIELRVITNETALGFRENFLRASLQARGDFIAFCDQDDVWRPDKLEKCAAFFEKPEVSMIVHAATVIDPASRETGLFRQGINETTIRPPLSYDPWSTFWGFSIVFRRELLRLVDIADRFVDFIVPTELIAHDRWIMFLGQMVGSTVEISDHLVGYRQHADNLFGTGRRKERREDVGLKARSEVYMHATSQMMGLIPRFSDDVSTQFPKFRKDQCLSFMSRALVQLELRHRIYAANTIGRSAYGFATCLIRGGYRNIHNDDVRWRSIVRDLRFVALRS